MNLIKLESRTIKRLLRLFNTNVSKDCLLFLEGKSTLPTVSPHNYTNPYSYLVDAQSVALLSKNRFNESSDLDALTLSKFLDCEKQCKETNIKFETLRSLPKLGYEWQVLFTARHYARMILKDIPTLPAPQFGPGSTTESGSRNDLVVKLGTPPSVTVHAYEPLHDYLKDYPHLLISFGLLERGRGSLVRTSRKLSITDYDCYTTVPKTYKTNRPICIQPGGNMLLQKAYGTLIRNRLREFGLNLDTRPDLHKLMLKNLDLMTVDLASASDTISYRLVEFLLPEEWFDALSSCRTRRTKLSNGDVIRLEKFSAMGNGYTFELESLIFYCLLLSIRKLNNDSTTFVSTFGDDIIMDRRYQVELFKVLTFCGFSINYEKTFYDGPFRESCGADEWNGIDVRPIYLKRGDKHEIEQLYYLANRVYEILYKLGYHDHTDRDVWLIHKSIIRRIPKRFRCFGPSHLGDQCLRSPYTGRITGKVRFIERKYAYKIKPGRCEPDHALMCALYGLPSSGVVRRNTPYTMRVRTYYGFHTVD